MLSLVVRTVPGREVYSLYLHKISTCPVQPTRNRNKILALSLSCSFIFIKSHDQKFSNCQSYMITHSSGTYTNLWADPDGRGLRRVSVVARLLGMQVRIPPGA